MILWWIPEEFLSPRGIELSSPLGVCGRHGTSGRHYLKMLDTQLKIKAMGCECLLVYGVVNVLLPSVNPLNVHWINKK